MHNKKYLGNLTNCFLQTKLCSVMLWSSIDNIVSLSMLAIEGQTPAALTTLRYKILVLVTVGLKKCLYLEKICLKRNIPGQFQDLHLALFLLNNFRAEVFIY